MARTAADLCARLDARAGPGSGSPPDAVDPGVRTALADVLADCYDITGDRTLLVLALDHARTAAVHTPATHEDRLDRLCTFAVIAAAMALDAAEAADGASGVTDEEHRSVDGTDRWATVPQAAAPPAEDPRAEHPRRRERNRDPLGEARDRLESAISAAHPEHPARPAAVRAFVHLTVLHWGLGARTTLEEADRVNRLLAMIPEDDPQRPAAVKDLRIAAAYHLMALDEDDEPAALRRAIERRWGRPFETGDPDGAALDLQVLKELVDLHWDRYLSAPGGIPAERTPSTVAGYARLYEAEPSWVPALLRPVFASLAAETTAADRNTGGRGAGDRGDASDAGPDPEAVLTLAGLARQLFAQADDAEGVRAKRRRLWATALAMSACARAAGPAERLGRRFPAVPEPADVGDAAGDGRLVVDALAELAAALTRALQG